MKNNLLKNKKIAIFHAFFKNKGGAEKVALQLRNYLNADLYTGAIRSDMFNNSKADSFSSQIYDPNYKFVSLHEDAKLPLWRHIKRQLYFLFSPKINQLNSYDILIVSGNVFWVITRMKLKRTKTKIVVYCHTPPRIFTDQKMRTLSKIPFFLRPFFNLISDLTLSIYKNELLKADLVIANSKNISNRLQKYLTVEVDSIFPPVSTHRFIYNDSQDYFLSHSRLEELKRIPLILEAFAKMPTKRLIICSTGPLDNWIKEQIRSRNLTNIEFLGIVTDEVLNRLVGNCLAGIVIPVEEDAGISQCELMAAGKPVLGVAEGGLIETVIHLKTGYLIKANPSVEDLIDAVNWLTKSRAISMKEDCINQSKLFSEEEFFDKIEEKLSSLVL